MSALDRLGPQFAQAVESYRSRATGLHDPACAFGECGEVSQHFENHLKAHGVEHEHVEYGHAVEHPPGAHPSWERVPLKMRAHHVTEVAGHTVDWTARQFDPEAPVPRIVPAEVSDAEWHEKLHGPIDWG